MDRKFKKFTTILFFLLLLNSAVQICATNYEGKDVFSEKKPFCLFNFDKGGGVNNLTGQSGIFDYDPNDKEAFCRIGSKKDEDLHKNGYHMKITYDVDSKKPAFNGFWTKLNGADLSNFYAISMTIKGDTEKGFSDYFKIEIKNRIKYEGEWNDRVSTYYVDDITDTWKTIVIPFDEFEGEIDYTSVNEFVMVFEDWRLVEKEGRYYIDDIVLIPKKGKIIKYSTILNRSSKQQVSKEFLDLLGN